MLKRGNVLIALAILLWGCSGQSNVLSGNTAAETGNAQQPTANAAGEPVADAAEPNSPAAVCTSDDTKAALRSLIASAIESGAAQGWKQSAALRDVMMLSSAYKLKNTLPALDFAQTTIERVDADTNRIVCSSSVIVEGEDRDGVHPRVSFIIQKTVDDGQNVVTLVSPLQVEPIAENLMTGVQRRLTAMSQPSARPTPEADGEEDRLNPSETASYNAAPIVMKACWVPPQSSDGSGMASQKRCSKNATSDDVVAAEQVYDLKGVRGRLSRPAQ